MFQKKRYFLSIFFCLLFLILCSLPGILPEHAAGDALNTSVSFDLPQTLSEPRVPFAVIDPSVQPSLTLYAKSAVLMDAESGRILYEKNGYEILPMASTTKIMTCILALENGDLNDYAEVSSYASGMPKVHLGARSGEFFRLEDLLYSLMLPSHNDTAVAIAEHVSGSTAKFVKLMNKKAAEIGCTNTHFATPNGLDAGYNHYTTASDLAKIAQYAIKKRMFRKLVSTSYYSFSNLNTGRSYSIGTTNALLGNVPGVQGMKTGYTNKAGYCFVGLSYSARGNTYISVVLGADSSSARWQDSRTLLTYAYNH